MKINLIGMILANCGERAFDGALVDSHGREMKAADSLRAMILEYARVWNGQESSFVALHHSNANPPGGACTTCGSDCNERDELTKAERAIEQLSKDAARYRWLRDEEHDWIDAKIVSLYQGPNYGREAGEDLDAIIDNEMAPKNYNLDASGLGVNKP
jgi:hypothetical protein